MLALKKRLNRTFGQNPARLVRCLGFCGEIAGSPQVPAGYGAPGVPFFGACVHYVGFGEVGGGDFVGGFEGAEGESESLADTVVRNGKDVGPSEAEHEEHFDGPDADAADLGEVFDDLGVGHAADAGERGDGAVDGFGGEVADGEGLVVREAGLAELFVGCGDEVFGGGVRGEVQAGGVGVLAGNGFGEAGEDSRVDGGGGFAVELLIDDGLEERFEG